MRTLAAKLGGAGLFARALRSSLLTVMGFGGAQFIRLLGNLILTRLLFPDAFGLMALVSVFLMGLGQLSDVGVTPAILQSKRGDDPEFLDTAWTIQCMRGLGLWIFSCGLAWPMALYYEEPQLAHILPVAAFSLAIIGFRPTKMDLANRHLNLGKVTLLELGVQVVGVMTAVTLAWLTGSVWALVASGLFSAAADVLLNYFYLPGKANRFRFEKAAAQELIHFGKWVFLATVCGFVLSQADKILMGKHLELDIFGIYNIGFFLASFPMLLGSVVVRKVLIPVYREAPPKESKSNFHKLQRMRFLVTAALMVLVTGFSIIGCSLVELLYDERYQIAGPVVVVLALASMPSIIALTYDQAALAGGGARDFFFLQLIRAALMVICLRIGLEQAGLLGGLIGQGVAFALMYPAVVWLARRMGAWDPLHDAFFFIVATGGAALSLWLNWEAIQVLMALNG